MKCRWTNSTLCRVTSQKTLTKYVSNSGHKKWHTYATTHDHKHTNPEYSTTVCLTHHQSQVAQKVPAISSLPVSPHVPQTPHTNYSHNCSCPNSPHPTTPFPPQYHTRSLSFSQCATSPNSLCLCSRASYRATQHLMLKLTGSQQNCVSVRFSSKRLFSVPRQQYLLCVELAPHSMEQVDLPSDYVTLVCIWPLISIYCRQ